MAGGMAVLLLSLRSHVRETSSASCLLPLPAISTWVQVPSSAGSPRETLVAPERGTSWLPRTHSTVGAMCHHLSKEVVSSPLRGFLGSHSPCENAFSWWARVLWESAGLVIGPQAGGTQGTWRSTRLLNGRWGSHSRFDSTLLLGIQHLPVLPTGSVAARVGCVMAGYLHDIVFLGSVPCEGEVPGQRGAWWRGGWASCSQCLIQEWFFLPPDQAFPI